MSNLQRKREENDTHTKNRSRIFWGNTSRDKRVWSKKNDRPYSIGDFVALNEWNGEEYTGKCTLHKIVYILNSTQYCKEGYVILGLEPWTIWVRGDLRTHDYVIDDRKILVYDRE